MAKMDEPCKFCDCLGFFQVFSHQNLDSRNQKFDLGNGIKTKNEIDAYNFKLQRDFPDFNFEDEKQA
jgi:hypothetical protein